MYNIILGIYYYLNSQQTCLPTSAKANPAVIERHYWVTTPLLCRYELKNKVWLLHAIVLRIPSILANASSARVSFQIRVASDSPSLLYTGVA